MGIFTLLPMGPPPTPDGHAQTQLQAAIPGGIGRPEQTPQPILDEFHRIGAPVTGQVGDKVNTLQQTVREALPAVSWEVHQVTAYIDHYIHIPWLHGDQAVVSHA